MRFAQGWGACHQSPAESPVRASGLRQVETLHSLKLYIANGPRFHKLDPNGCPAKKDAKRGDETMNHSNGPLGAAQGVTLGCLFSAVLWLALINIVLFTQQIPS